MAQRQRYTEAEDEAYDRSRGIREGSPRDARLDRKRNLPADRNYGQQSGDTWKDLRNLPLSPLGERTLAGYRARYQDQGDRKFYEAIRSGTLSQSMWAGNSKPTDPAERSNAGLAGAHTRGGAGNASDVSTAPPGLRTFSRNARPAAGQHGMDGLQQFSRRGPEHAATPGDRQPGFGGPPRNTSTVGGGAPIGKTFGKQQARHGELAGLKIQSRE